MKNFYSMMFIAALVLLPVINAGESKAAALPGSAGYDPNVPYQGGFEKDRIYKQRTSTDYWKGNSKPAKIYSVKCTSAVQSLSSLGTWTGNLLKDGTCGSTAEPATWATGNYLNFLSVLDSAQ